MSVPHLCGPGQGAGLVCAFAGEVRDWIVVQVARGVPRTAQHSACPTVGMF